MIGCLAEQLALIAPSTSPGDGFCVQRIAEQMNLKKHWKKQKNKRLDIEHLLRNVFRRYPRKPKTLVLEIVKGGITWMARRGEKVEQHQLNEIVQIMSDLGFDIKEILKINIPSPSRVREPTADIVYIFERLGLHELLRDDIAEMFRDGHFNEAVRKALERFEKTIQDMISDQSLFGRDIMSKAFNDNNPLIALNDLKTANDRSEQQGFRFITMGAMSGMRNLYSHGDISQMSAVDAIERLAFISMLFKRIDKSKPTLLPGLGGMEGSKQIGK